MNTRKIDWNAVFAARLHNPDVTGDCTLSPETIDCASMAQRSYIIHRYVAAMGLEDQATDLLAETYPGLDWDGDNYSRGECSGTVFPDLSIILYTGGYDATFDSPRDFVESITALEDPEPGLPEDGIETVLLEVAGWPLYSIQRWDAEGDAWEEVDGLLYVSTRAVTAACPQDGKRYHIVGHVDGCVTGTVKDGEFIHATAAC